MSEELRPCPFCGYEPETRKVIVYPNGEKSPAFIKCRRCNYGLFGYNYEALVVHWNCRPIENTLRDELIDTDMLLKEATEAIGAVVACCTYNSNDDAKIGIYGIDQKAFTRIDQFITHYNDAVSAGKVSVDVKRELTDAEITRLENRFADTEACNGRLVEQVEQLTAENKRLKAVLNEWDMAWLTDCIAPQPNGNEAFGLDEGLVLCARMMKPILEETRLLLGKAEVVR